MLMPQYFTLIHHILSYVFRIQVAPMDTSVWSTLIAAVPIVWTDVRIFPPSFLLLQLTRRHALRTEVVNRSST